MTEHILALGLTISPAGSSIINHIQHARHFSTLLQPAIYWQIQSWNIDPRSIEFAIYISDDQILKLLDVLV